MAFPFFVCLPLFPCSLLPSPNNISSFSIPALFSPAGVLYPPPSVPWFPSKMPSESIISAVNTPQQSTLVLVVGQRKHLSLIPPHLLPLAELCWRRTTPSTPEDGTELEELEIFSSFLSGILNHPTDQYLDGSSKKALLGWGLGHLQERFLRENDVHVVARGFRSQSQIVGTYFHVVDYLQASRYVKYI